MSNRAEELITQLEAEIAKRDARIAEFDRDLSLAHMACELAEEELAALKAQPSAGVVDERAAFKEAWPAIAGNLPPHQRSWSAYSASEVEFAEHNAAEEAWMARARLNPCRAQAVACVACEGHPMGVNNPCAVCGGAQAVPDGYVLVPVDPTPEMLDRYPFNVSAATSEPMDTEDLRVVYQAMIAAAPSAQKESGDE